MTRTMPTHELTLLTSRARLPLLATLAVRFAGLVVKWDHNKRSRQRLKDLDQHLLQDIGLTAEQAGKEANRPFWSL